MASYNRVMLIGNLTRDIELRHTPGGTAVTDLGMAVNDRRKNAQGEWVDDVTYVDITLWGRTAEIAAEYLRKGSPVFIEGRLRYETWEADGQKKSRLKVVGERLQLLGSRQDDSGRTDSGRGGSSASSARQVHESYQDDSAEDYAPPGRRDAQPTGGGSSYQDPDIPF
ncbi:MAG: single-stranded DNA-binding protein [Planctomycetaceae bacterium]|nr:MAG: single-stranded DNA-binding protein [Planctomycetaceae bacterium]